MRKIIVYSLLCALHLGMAVTVCAQTESNKAEKFSYIPLGSNKLLPAVGVVSLCQDSEGYMWYGVENGGLCRDNGHQIDRFKNDRWNPILMGRSSDVRVVIEDMNGNICFGTHDACHVIKKSDYRIFNPDTLLNGKKVASICMTTDGHLWVGAEDTVYRYDRDYNRVKAYPIPHKTERKTKGIAVFADDEDNVWAMLSPQGFAKLGKTEKAFRSMPWTVDNFATSMVYDKYNKCYWLGTEGSGIVKYVPGSAPQVADIGLMPYTDQRKNVKKLIFDHSRKYLWAVTSDNVFAYDVSSGTLKSVALGYPGEFDYKVVHDVLVDSKGNVWVAGTNPQTFILHSNSTPVVHDRMEGVRKLVPFQLITQAFVQENGRSWTYNDHIGVVLTDKTHGVVEFGTKLHKNIKPDFVPAYELGGIWAHSASRLVRLKEENGKIKNEDFDINADHIQCVADDGKGHVFVGTRADLIVYDYHNKTSKQLLNGKGNMHCLAIGLDGNAYFCTANVGLMRCSYDGKSEVLVSDGYYDCMAVDSYGNIWVGNAFGDVFCYDIKTHAFELNNMLSNPGGESVLSLAADRKGNVCAVTCRFATVYNVKSGRTAFVSADEKSNDMKYFVSGSVDNDQLCVIGAGGIVRFSADKLLQRNNRIESPIVCRYSLDGVDVLPYKDQQYLSIPAGTFAVQVFFSNREYIESDMVQYSYRMNHGDWLVLPKGVNFINFAVPNPGHYVLEVRATDNNGKWSDVATAYEVDVLPAWYQTTLAYTLFNVSILLILVAIFLIAFFLQRQRNEINLRIRNLMDQLDLSTNHVSMVEDDASEVSEDGHEDDNGGDEQEMTDVKEGRSLADQNFLDKAVAVVHANISNSEYDQEQFSYDMCVSRASLYRRITLLTGQKPTEFIRTIRLKRAAELLKEDKYSVTEIIEMVGFSSTSYFNRCFKEVFGVQPSKYK